MMKNEIKKGQLRYAQWVDCTYIVLSEKMSSHLVKSWYVCLIKKNDSFETHCWLEAVILLDQLMADIQES